jgi:hypothetical protein
VPESFPERPELLKALKHLKSETVENFPKHSDPDRLLANFLKPETAEGFPNLPKLPNLPNLWKA